MKYILKKFVNENNQYVEWLHDDKNVYEIVYKTKEKKSNEIISKKILDISSLVEDMESKLSTTKEIDTAIIKYFEEQIQLEKKNLKNKLRIEG